MRLFRLGHTPPDGVELGDQLRTALLEGPDPLLGGFRLAERRFENVVVSGLCVRQDLLGLPACRSHRLLRLTFGCDLDPVGLALGLADHLHRILLGATPGVGGVLL